MADLRQSASEILTKRRHVLSVNRSTPILNVDWQVLLTFNPPPGYRCTRETINNQQGTHQDDRGGSEQGVETHDPVVVILQNILSNVERDIREETRRVKEEKRNRRRQRRLDREQQLKTNMDMRSRRHQFPTVLSPRGIPDVSKRHTGDVGHQSPRSLGLADMLPRQVLTRNSSSGTLVGYSSSELGHKWSRYSQDTSECNSDDDTCCTNNDQEVVDDDALPPAGPRFDKGAPVKVARSESLRSVNRTELHANHQNGITQIYDRHLDYAGKEIPLKKHVGQFEILPNMKWSSPDKLDIDGRIKQRRKQLMSKSLSEDIQTMHGEAADVENGKYNTNMSGQKGLIESHQQIMNQGSSSRYEYYKNNIERIRDATAIVKVHDLNTEDTETNGGDDSQSKVDFFIGDPETDMGRKERDTKLTANRLRKKTKGLVRQRRLEKAELHASAAKEDIQIDDIKDHCRNDTAIGTLQNDIDMGDLAVNEGAYSSVKDAADTQDIARFRTNSTTHDKARSRELERPHSAGTSGYSTEDCSSEETSDTEDDVHDQDPQVTDKALDKPFKGYFIVHRKGSTMAVQMGNSRIPDQANMVSHSQSPPSTVSMSDLAIPDHVGCLTDQSEQTSVWGVVVDMLFCIFENQESEKPKEVILLPGCNIRPLVYKTAINGLNTRKQGKTITGVAKYQFVIDDSSSGRKHLFSVESQSDLDVWLLILKKASTLDQDILNDQSSSTDDSQVTANKRRVSTDENSNKPGYMPTNDAPSRVQKMSSPMNSPRDLKDSETDMNGHADESSSHLHNGHGGQPSPRAPALVRHDSTRGSVRDFKKRLRREPEPEHSKQQPVKAQHFVPNMQDETKALPEKKLRSFGSFESLLKFKRKRRKKSSSDTNSSGDSNSIASTSSVEPDITSQSLDFSPKQSQLSKSKTKQLSKSLDLGQPKNSSGKGLVRTASDIKDRVLQRRPNKPHARLGDLPTASMIGYLHHKHHLKWQKMWCVVCRGCFYGFKTQNAEENAHLAVILSNCVIVYVTEKDKRDRRLYVFKLTQEKARSVYLCAGDYKELLQWLTVLQLESNSLVANSHKIRKPPELGETDSICSSGSSQTGTVQVVEADVEHSSRSRSKKTKRAPVKPPRHSSCPPSVSREPLTSERVSESSTGEGSVSSQSEDQGSLGSNDDIPRHDRAVTHVWQSDRGYLFNVIRSKLRAYKTKDETIYNKDLPGADNQGLLLVQDNGPSNKKKGSREVRRSRSFNAHTANMNDESTKKSPTTPTGSPTIARKRHKPLVVKKVPASDLTSTQTTAGYMERKGFNAQWIKYWYILHEGTLFCYLTSDDSITVDVLNLHGYTVTSLVDKFRGKRFVLQLSHENFTSLYLSMESREDMDSWQQFLGTALKQPSSQAREETDDESEQGACAGCENNRREDVGERRKQVKQKLLEEMLRQKHELERKQAERHKKQKNKDPDSPDWSPNSSYANEFMADDQRTCDVTRLRQRRMSTQLKVETIQKQIVKPSHTKRGIFSFGKTKKLDENKNVFLQDQLKELNEKLHKIDTDIKHVEHDKPNGLEVFDVNQNKKRVSTNASVPLVGDVNDRTIDNDEDKRANGIKSTMKHWTNKTFNKSSTKRKQTQSQQNQLQQNSNMLYSGSVPNLHSGKMNGDIVNGVDCVDHGESDTTSEDFLSLDNSVTDLTRPTSDLRLDLNLSYGGSTGSGSPRYARSNSRSSTVSTLSSPRREINPSVLAEIDAFEELTRQVLGARSKELPTK